MVGSAFVFQADALPNEKKLIRNEQNVMIKCAE